VGGGWQGWVRDLETAVEQHIRMCHCLVEPNRLKISV